MLPALQYPKNALLNFAPVTTALNNMRTAEDDRIAYEASRADRERQFGLQERRIAADAESRNALLGMKRAEFEQRQKMMPGQLELQRLQIQGAQNSADPMYGVNQRTQIADKLGINGPGRQQFIATGTLPKADPMAPLINRLMQGGGTGAPETPGTDPNIRPQSYTSGGIQPNDPNLIKTQTAGGQPAPVASDMVNTPLGRMSKQQAERMGLALALSGKGKAGELLIGAAKENSLEDAARNKVDANELAAVEGLARVREIANKFEPKYQTYENYFKQFGVKIMDSVGFLRDKIKPEDRAEYEQYISYRRDAIDNINRYIKEITGAQMSEAEATRLRKGVPDPETDSPTEFAAKLKSVTRSMQLAIARSRYLRKNGFTGNALAAEGTLPIEKMGDIINKRADFLLKQARSQGVDQDRAIPEVRQRLRAEFGFAI